MRRVLTDEQLQQARKLRDQGYTKKKLAEIYEVGQTTIWENVFSNRKRVRITTYTFKPKKVKEFCKICEIVVTREPKGNYIPHNFKVGDRCLLCYLEDLKIRYLDLINN